MEPTFNPPTVTQTPQTIVQKVNNPIIIILSVLMGALLSAVLTFSVLYYLNPNIFTLVLPSASNNGNVAIPPKDDEVNPPTGTVDSLQPEEEPMEETLVTEPVKYVTKNVGVEARKGQGVVINIKLSLPESSTITEGAGSAASSKIITYKDDTTGTTVITFTLAQFGLQSALKNHTKIESSMIEGLYRVQNDYQAKNTPKLFVYSNEVTLVGTCKEGDQTIKAVCGLDQVEGLIVTVENSKKDFSIADKIASTFVISKK